LIWQQTVQASLSAGYHFTPKFSMFATVCSRFAKRFLFAVIIAVDGQVDEEPEEFNYKFNIE
jgi:hypothetical protein